MGSFLSKPLLLFPQISRSVTLCSLSHSLSFVKIDEDEARLTRRYLQGSHEDDSKPKTKKCFSGSSAGSQLVPQLLLRVCQLLHHDPFCCWDALFTSNVHVHSGLLLYGISLMMATIVIRILKLGILGSVQLNFAFFIWAYVPLRLQQVHCFWGAIKVDVGLVAVEILGNVDFG
ncbi:unnamed protein product [Ilex paraguariensis]|uniref:Uncharacterized protein n=1 Tax=Ilex paraguariensis TaxID=185542 RepID=A0ABC8TMM7_9AQUA